MKKASGPKQWHVMSDQGWERVTSESRPYGRLAHVITDDCKLKSCGKVGGYKL